MNAGLLALALQSGMLASPAVVATLSVLQLCIDEGGAKGKRLPAIDARGSDPGGAPTHPPPLCFVPACA